MACKPRRDCYSVHVIMNAGLIDTILHVSRRPAGSAARGLANEEAVLGRMREGPVIHRQSGMRGASSSDRN